MPRSRRRGELIIIAPVGYRKTEDQRLEKDPDRRVQEAIRLVFDQFERIGSVRQTLLWFHEHLSRSRHDFRDLNCTIVKIDHE